MVRVMTALLALMLVQDDIPPALRAMADTERAFAQAATVKGIRDAFLEFFSPNAVALVPEPESFPDRLRARPAVPFSDHELRWEPRLGDVAASGDLGWLTGPSTFTNHRDKQPPRHGNYLSIWRKQTDGTWKVLFDVGANAPSPVPFTPGLTRFAMPSRFSGQEPRIASQAALFARDRALNAQLTTAGYKGFLAPGARLHRDGMVALVGEDAIARWFATQPPVTATADDGASAASGDLGYTYGVYEKKAPAERGSYLRLWSRTADRQWLLTVEVMNAAPAR